MSEENLIEEFKKLVDDLGSVKDAVDFWVEQEEGSLSDDQKMLLKRITLSALKKAGDDKAQIHRILAKTRAYARRNTGKTVNIKDQNGDPRPVPVIHRDPGLPPKANREPMAEGDNTGLVDAFAQSRMELLFIIDDIPEAQYEHVRRMIDAHEEQYRPQNRDMFPLKRLGRMRGPQ